MAFWTRLQQRLDGLSNRIDTSQRGVILTAVDARSQCQRRMSS